MAPWLCRAGHPARPRLQWRWWLARLARNRSIRQGQGAPRRREERRSGHHLGDAAARGGMDSSGLWQIVFRYRRAVPRRQRHRRESDRRGAGRTPPGRCLSELADRDDAAGAARFAGEHRLVAVRHRQPQHRLRRQDGLHQQHRLHRRLQQQAGEGCRRPQELDRHSRRALQGKGCVQHVSAAAADRRAGPRLGGGQGTAIRARHRRQNEPPAHARAARIAAAIGRARLRVRGDRFPHSCRGRRGSSGRVRWCRSRSWSASSVRPS